MNVVDAALKAAMVADTGTGNLADLSNGGFFQMVAPDKTAFNYTLFQCLVELPDYAFGNRELYRDVPYQIRHYAVDGANNSTKSAQEIAGSMDDRCRIVLTNAALNVSGKTLLICRFDRSIPLPPERDEANDRWIIGKGSIYKIGVA